MADYNLALDKQRTDARVEDVQVMFEHIKGQNDRQKVLLDNLFIERKTQEEKITELENNILEINQQTEARLMELEPEQKME